jgi:hypothetical protein
MNTDEKKVNSPKKPKYGQAYIVPQKYENLLSLNTAIILGTIFKNLVNNYTKTE